MSQVIFRTVDRASLDGLSFAIRPDAVLLGEVRSDESPAMQVGFLSVESAREFVHELQLEDVRVLAAPHEDVHALRAAILGDATGATVH